MLIFHVVRLGMEVLAHLEEHHSAMVRIVDLQLIDIRHIVIIFTKHYNSPNTGLDFVVRFCSSESNLLDDLSTPERGTVIASVFEVQLLA